ASAHAVDDTGGASIRADGHGDPQRPAAPQWRGGLSHRTLRTGSEQSGSVSGRADAVAAATAVARVNPYDEYELLSGTRRLDQRGHQSRLAARDRQSR